MQVPRKGGDAVSELTEKITFMRMPYSVSHFKIDAKQKRVMVTIETVWTA